MENCHFHGKEICSYELKDKHGIYHQDQVIELKKAAAKGELRCVDCGQRVYLAAGLIKEPYFSHYDLENCSYGATAESEESKKGKRLLYHLLTSSFKNHNISVRHRMEEGFYSSFYVPMDTGMDLAIEYRLTQLPMKLLEQRMEYYQEHKVKPIMILGIRQDKGMNQLNWYQEYVQKELGYCIFLNSQEETITVKRSFLCSVGRYRQSQVFDHTYPIKELAFQQNGTFTFDFLSKCEQKEKQIMTSLEEKLRLEKEVQERQFAYYQNQKLLQEQREYERFHRILQSIDFTQVVIPQGIRRDILLSCVDMIKNGDIDMVSEKYLTYIMSVMRSYGYQKQ